MPLDQQQPDSFSSSDNKLLPNSYEDYDLFLSSRMDDMRLSTTMRGHTHQEERKLQMTVKGGTVLEEDVHTDESKELDEEEVAQIMAAGNCGCGDIYPSE